MSGQNINQEDPVVIAERAERELNSHEAKAGHFDLDRSGKHGKPVSSTTTDSGINADVEKRFPGAEVKYGSEASGAGNNRDIPDEEGGGINPMTGKQTKAGDFEGIGGPEDKMRAAEAQRPGENDIDGNVRQKGTTVGETKRPNPTGGNVQ